MFSSFALLIQNCFCKTLEFQSTVGNNCYVKQTMCRLRLSIFN